MAADDSLGNQFNKQYQETIDLVKSRAIWRIGEKLSECDVCGGMGCQVGDDHRGEAV